MEKKKISLKEIGMPKIIMMFAAGVLLILLTFPGILGSDKDNKNKNLIQNYHISKLVRIWQAIIEYLYIRIRRQAWGNPSQGFWYWGG